MIARRIARPLAALALITTTTVFANVVEAQEPDPGSVLPTKPSAGKVADKAAEDKAKLDKEEREAEAQAEKAITSAEIDLDRAEGNYYDALGKRRVKLLDPNPHFVTHVDAIVAAPDFAVSLCPAAGVEILPLINVMFEGCMGGGGADGSYRGSMGVRLGGLLRGQTLVFSYGLATGAVWRDYLFDTSKVQAVYAALPDPAPGEDPNPGPVALNTWKGAYGKIDLSLGARLSRRLYVSFVAQLEFKGRLEGLSDDKRPKGSGFPVFDLGFGPRLGGHF